MSETKAEGPYRVELIGQRRKKPWVVGPADCEIHCTSESFAERLAGDLNAAYAQGCADRDALVEVLRETTAEAIEHRRNIIEARQAGMLNGPAALDSAYHAEIARFDALIDRANAVLAKAGGNQK